MSFDFSEFDASFYWDRAFAAADANWRRLPSSERANAIVDALLQRQVRVVLDLGCAVGRLSMLIAAQGIEVYGLDASEKAISFARSWALDEHMPNVHFDVGLANSLPYSTGSFDAVISNAVLDHMPRSETLKAVREMWAVLRPGGLAYATFDGVEGRETWPHHTLEDGTRIYVHGMHRGLIWRYWGDPEILGLFSRFDVDDLKTEKDGSRVLVCTKRSQ
jgi:SAM-dependent methyltransferase